MVLAIRRAPTQAAKQPGAQQPIAPIQSLWEFSKPSFLLLG
jgi:hypothetical protein